MQFVWSPEFQKRYKKLPTKIQERTKERLEIFMLDAFHHLLNNNKLTGKYQTYRSINITGNYRAIYRNTNENTIFFITVGTHSELYE